MQIQITRSDGAIRSFNGDILYHNTYIGIRYRNSDDGNKWIELAIPWRIIDEVEVKP